MMRALSGIADALAGPAATLALVAAAVLLIAYVVLLGLWLDWLRIQAVSGGGRLAAAVPPRIAALLPPTMRGALPLPVGASHRVPPDGRSHRIPHPRWWGRRGVEEPRHA